MPTFDGDNLIITLDSGITSVDIGVDLYKQWKQWALNGNLHYPQAFRTIGGDPLSAIINAGDYYFIQNQYGWRIRPAEEDATIYLSGNLAAENTALPSFIQTIGAYTVAVVGLQPVTQGVTPQMALQLEQISFAGHVSIKTTGVALTPDGKTSAGNPIGTMKDPVSNEADALIIALSHGIPEFMLLDSMTIDTTNFSNGYKFKGISPVTVAAVIDTSANVLNCEFSDMQISGVLDGNSVLRECVVGSLNYVNGFIYNSALDGTIVLGGGANASIQGCWQQKKQTDVIIDMGGSGQQLSVSDFKGHVTIKNCTGAGQSYISGDGHIVLDSTISSGTFTLFGDLTFDDNTTGTAVIIDNTSSALVWSGVSGTEVLSNVKTSRKVLQNKTQTDPVTGVMTVYDDDGTTVLFTANIWENIAATTPYSGNAVNRRDNLA